MKLLEQTPDQIRQSAAALPFVQQNDPYATPGDLTDQGSSAIDAAWASFRRENTIYSLSYAKGVNDAVGQDDDFDPEFNPYQWMKDNLDPKVVEQLAEEIDQGYYDYATGPRDMQSRVILHMHEKALLKEQEDHAIASFLGGALGAILDPTILVPGLGAGSRAVAGLSKAARIGAGTTAAMTVVGAQELALHQAQDLRTWKESLMNVGVAGAFVGGLGAFGVALQKGGILHPENIHNPLRPENLRDQGVEAHVPGMEGNDIVLPQGSASLSAAAVDMGLASPAPRKLAGDGVMARLSEKIGESAAMRFGTPVGRALRWTSDLGVNTVVRLMDVGGVLTDTNRFGKRTGLSAEDIKRDYETLGNKVLMRADQAVRELSKEMTRKMKVEDFWSTARKTLNGTLNDSDLLGLEKAYGKENVDKVIAKVSRWTDEVHQVNEVFERKLMDYGFLRDEEAVASLRDRVDQLQQQIEKDLEPFRKQYNDAKEALKGKTGDERKAQVAAVEKLKQDLEVAEAAQATAKGHLQTAREDLRAQLALPKSLGRDYGYAQLWDDSVIMADHEAFEDFLLRALVDSPDEDWLMEAFRLTTSEFENLKTADRAQYDSIVRDWAGDREYFEIARLERALKSAKIRAEDAENEFSEVARQLGLVKRNEAAANLSEARKFRDRLQAQLEAARTARDAAAQEARAFKAAATAARQKTLDRQSSFIEVKPDAGAAELERFGRAEGRTARFFETGKATQGEARLQHGESKETRTTTSDPKGIEKVSRVFDEARKDAFERPIEAAPAPEPKRTVALADAEARASELDRQLAREDARVTKAEERLARFEEAHAEATARRENVKAARDFLEDYAKTVKEQRNLSAKNVAELKRKLKAKQKKVPLEEAVRTIRKNLSDRETLPTAIMDRVVPETGRMKARRIMLSPEFRREAEDAGWLRTDLQRILPLQYRQLGGHLGIREAFDIGPGRRYQSWQQILDEVRDDYDAMKATAREAGDTKRVSELQAEFENLEKDIATLKGRLLGTEDLGIDPNHFLAWTSRKVRQASFLRFGSTFLISSLTDIGIMALRHRMLPMMAKYGRRALMESVNTIPESNIQSMVYATEIGSRAMMMHSRLGDADIMQMSGFGVRGTRRQKVSAAIDLVGDKLTDKVLMVSLMPQWNRMWKIMSGLQLNDELGKLLRDYDNIPLAKRTDLASLGIGREEAQRIAAMIEKHGIDEDGLFNPRIERWIDEPGGDDLARIYRVALQRDMNRSILTLGIGDTPRIMDKWYGKVLLQFQSFAFKFTNGYLRPLIQRGAHLNDIRAAASFALLMASTAFVIALKDKMRGEDPAARYEEDRLRETSLEFLDRSGLMGYMAPYFQAGAKLTGIEGSSRYSRQNWFEPILGANAGLFGDVQRFGSAVFEGDGEDAQKKALLLMPFGSLIRSGIHLFADD